VQYNAKYSLPTLYNSLSIQLLRNNFHFVS
jgi:hypothetical protein